MSSLTAKAIPPVLVILVCIDDLVWLNPVELDALELVALAVDFFGWVPMQIWLALDSEVSTKGGLGFVDFVGVELLSSGFFPAFHG